MSPLSFFRKKKAEPVVPSSPSSPSAPSAPSPEEVVEPEVEPELDEDVIEEPARDTAADYAAVTEAFAAWQTQLHEGARDIVLDPSAPDVLDVSSVNPAGAAQFFSGSATPLGSLFREPDSLAGARTVVQHLTERVRQLEEAYGSAPVSLVYGTLTWSEMSRPAPFHETTDALVEEFVPEQDTAEPVEADDSLDEVDETVVEDHEVTDGEGTSADEAVDEHGDQVPEEPEGAHVVEVTEPAIRRDVHVASTTASDPIFTLSEVADVSSSVLDALRRHGAPAAAVSEVRGLAHNPDTIDEALRRLRELGRVYLPGCVYTPMTIVALASSPSVVLLDDLQAMEPEVRASEFVADLVSGRTASVEIPRVPVDRDPASERGVGRLDVAELDAVEAVANGTSVFLNSVPGSDSRRVLASIAADNAASGKRVLYVSGCPAAHASFVDEMNRVGLGETVVDFADPSAVPMRLRTGLRLKSGSIDSEEASEKNAALVSHRDEVTEFMTALHTEDERWKVTPFDLLGRIVALSLDEKGPRPQVRLDDDTLVRLASDEERTSKASLLDESLRLRADASETNPWSGSKLYTDEDAQTALEAVTELADVSLPALIDQSQRTSTETGLKPALTLDEWDSQLDLLRDVADSLETFQGHMYERSASDMVIATASKEWRNRHGHQMSGSDRRRLTKEAKDMIRPGRDVPDLHEALVKIAAERDTWKAQAEPGSFPELPDGVEQMHAVNADVRAAIASLVDVLPEGDNFTTMPLTSLQDRLTALARGAEDLETLPRRNSIDRDLDEAGLTALATNLYERKIAPHQAEGELDAAYLASVFEHMFSTIPALAAHHANIGDLVATVVAEDAAHVAAMPEYVNRAVIARMRSLITKKKDATLEVDAYLDHHGLSGIKEAVAKASDILTAARPVWAMNAVTVAQYLPPTQWADLVILDGIDAIDQAQLVPSLLRGRTRVISGYAGRDGSSSTLATALPVIDLPVFNSRSDAMTADVLARHGFGAEHEVYPSAPTRSAPVLKIVDGAGVPGPKSGLVEAPEKEVTAVVDTVLDLALTRPDESIAVVAANVTHAQRIRQAIREITRTSTALGALTDPTRPEPFTIVDLTGASSIVRDHIILTIGLGKTVHGRLLHSFGLLSSDAGLAGLVDALEAPRQSLTLISSFSAADIDRSRLNAEGARLLVDLLEAYAGGSSATPAGPADQGTTGALLDDIAWRLVDRGYEAKVHHAHHGSKAIPLVAGHEDIPGTWAVAVTIDDDAYVSEPSLRRRDVFWPGMLSAKGWSVVPCFSTAVFFDPKSQAERIIAEIDARRSTASKSASFPAHLDVSRIDSDLDEKGTHSRGPRPKVTPGLPLAAYSDDELDQLATWIASDGRERTEEEFVSELRAELALHRRGAQIDAVLSNVVRRR